MRPYGLAVRRSGGQAGEWAGPGRRLNAKETGSREAIRHQFYAPGQETPGRFLRGCVRTKGVT
ncbi:hypothetical protein N658DRAFT_496435 [Parathielavia hyrcaniae]|uniref:Uncharacterized protein n=1 Tax=Parathielavia hyrcaniae TaxID=113614 RepID=A0AAN6Q5U6_9PEZI|nr:hypothetical protein N658DRAFT_501393 [Parathielavia hyrcaniae]KAK4098752.1 hypothetical protein N658DRAFT_498988 [Parathielavia hyrcaniae]KAK4101551.1 hypothetical protein N658DRAFT_496435 [Parathielavia hyrcaniae]